MDGAGYYFHGEKDLQPANANGQLVHVPECSQIQQVSAMRSPAAPAPDFAPLAIDVIGAFSTGATAAG
jgi:hypothetical protein